MLEKLNPSRNFGARLVYFIAGLSLVTALAFSLLVGERARQDLTKSTGDSLAELAFQMVDKLDRGMFERYREIQIMTTWPLLRQADADPALKRAVLEKLKDTHPVHSWIAITDAKGAVVAATGGLLEGRDLSHRPWFPGARNGPYVGDVHGALLLSRHLPAPTDGNLRFVDVAAPLHDREGRFIGVLCSHLNWEWAREVRSSLFHELQGSAGIEVFILNRKGEVMLGPSALGQEPPPDPGLVEMAKALKGGKGYFARTWPDGQVCLTGLAPSSGYLQYPGLGWVVAVRQNVETALAPARRLQKDIFSLSLTLGLLTALLGWAVARRLSRPLRSIAVAADQMRQGRTELRLPTVDRQDEIGVLARSLGALVESLKRSNAELAASRDLLEDRVRERTADLSVAKDELENELKLRRKVEAELRDSQERLNQAQHLAKLGSFEQDLADGRVHFSDELYNLLGHPPGGDDPSLEALYRRVHPEDLGPLKAFWDGREDEASLKVRLLLDDGQEKYCQARLSRLRGPEGTVRGCRGVLLDATARRQAELLRAEAERIMRHDLKAPLNAIINLPPLLTDAGGLNPAQAEVVEMIQEAGLQMLSQIDASLDIYKMEMGVYQLEPLPLDLVALSRRVMREMEGEARRRGVKTALTLDGRMAGEGESLTVSGQDTLLHAMLANLVKNAVEAAPAGSLVTVDLARSAELVAAAVHNPGAVPEDVRARFFQKYASSGKKGGMGLGAYSARLIARAHGGSAELETSEEAGTTVRVWLPAGPHR